MAPHDALCWWRQADVAQRFVTDVLHTEMALLRPGGWRWPAAGPDRNLHLVHDLQADSLEMMSLAAAMADVLPRQSASIAEDLYAHASVQGWTQLLVAEFDDAYAEQGASLTMRFRTSGSTGTPKSCPHRLGDLAQEMQAMATVLADGSRPIRRCVSTVRSHHIYGFLFTVLLPRLMGGDPLPVLCWRGRPPLGLEHLLQSGDLVVSFPDWWWAAQRVNARFPADVVGVSSTAPCPEDVALGMLDAGLQAFLHIYGSSETAGVGWRASGIGKAGFQLHDFWQRASDDPDQLLRLRADGSTRTVVLQDHLQWLPDGRFLPGARRDATVQVGGVNVDLQQLQVKLQGHPAVRAVALRLHPFDGGPRLKAWVVPAHGALFNHALQDALTTWCRQHLAPAARPVHWTFGPALPVNAQGKACDWPVDSSP